MVIAALSVLAVCFGILSFSAGAVYEEKKDPADAVWGLVAVLAGLVCAFFAGRCS